MSAAQWAPWVSVFVGGCLSGAALLSLTSERAADAPRVVTVSLPADPPSEPADTDVESELGEEETAAPDVTVKHTSDVEPAELGESEHGPSAADILSALEQAYQRQVAAEEAASAPPEPTVLEATGVEAEVAPPPAAPPAVPAASPDERVAQIEAEPEPETDDATSYADPVQVATAARADQNQAAVQQIAVVYQPVYVLPPTDPSVPSSTSSRRRSVGRDPWAPLAISPRHNPWGTAGGSGAWATVGVAGGVWAGGFTSRP